MPFDTHLLEVMNDLCTWAPEGGLDQFGNPTYGTPVSFRANLFLNEMRGTTGDQDATYGTPDNKAYTIYCQYLGIKPRDKITLPDGTVTYVDSVTTYNDPIKGDPSVQQLGTKELR